MSWLVNILQSVSIHCMIRKKRKYKLIFAQKCQGAFIFMKSPLLVKQGVLVKIEKHPLIVIINNMQRNEIMSVESL